MVPYLKSSYQNPACTSCGFYICHMTPPTISNSSWFEQRNNNWSGVQIINLLVMYSYSTVSEGLLLVFMFWIFFRDLDVIRGVKSQDANIRFSQNCEKRILASSCLSLCLEQLGSHWADFREIWYLMFVWKSIEKIRVWLKPGKKNWYFT